MAPPHEVLDHRRAAGLRQVPEHVRAPPHGGGHTGLVPHGEELVAWQPAAAGQRSYDELPGVLEHGYVEVELGATDGGALHPRRAMS